MKPSSPGEIWTSSCIHWQRERQGGAGAGAINRVLEVEVPGPLFEDYQFTLETVRTNYGHAGRVFVEYVQSFDVGALKEEHKAICSGLSNYDSTGKQVQNLAFLILADRIAGRCIFHGEDPLRTEDVAAILKSKQEISEYELFPTGSTQDRKISALHHCI